jgi:DNA-binding NarL/FixJ family response regulator
MRNNDDFMIPLTPREDAIARAFVVNSDRIKLAETFGISDRTVDSHLATISGKMGSTSSIEIIKRFARDTDFVHTDKDLIVFSRREMQILEQLQKGKSNKEIASGLFLSVKTVEVNLQNMYKKASTANRFQLASISLRYPEKFICKARRNASEIRPVELGAIA